MLEAVDAATGDTYAPLMIRCIGFGLAFAIVAGSGCSSKSDDSKAMPETAPRSAVPGGDTGGKPAAVVNQLTVRVHQDGTLSLGFAHPTADELEIRLKASVVNATGDLTLHIDADPNAPTDLVNQVEAIAKSVGVTKIVIGPNEAHRPQPTTAPPQ